MFVPKIKLSILCLLLSFCFSYEAKATTVEECINGSVEEAIHICSIQNKLMVAALSCENAREKYNRFATKFKSSISKNGKVLKDYFQCRNGKKAIIIWTK